MKSVRVVLTVALSLMAFIMARPASVDAGGFAPPTSLHTTAPGAHTCVQVVATRASHAAHLRHNHYYHAATLSAAATKMRPQPRNPARQRHEHRAALPRVASGGRTHSGPRDGQRAFATVTALRSLLTVAVAPMDSDQNQIVRGREGFPLESRGPPRAGPFDSLPPSFAGGLPQYLLSTAPTRHPSRSTETSRARSVLHGAPVCLRSASSYRFIPSQEPPTSCSHACRPEGAAVCCDMPSIGGLT